MDYFIWFGATSLRSVQCNSKTTHRTTNCHVGHIYTVTSQGTKQQSGSVNVSAFQKKNKKKKNLIRTDINVRLNRKQRKNIHSLDMEVLGFASFSKWMKLR